MKSNSQTNGDTGEVVADHDDQVVAGIMMLLGSDGSNSNRNNNRASQSLNTQLGEGIAADDSNAKLTTRASIPETAPPARQTSSIASSNSNGGSVTFALPATYTVATSSEVRPTRGYGSAASCESLSSSGGEQRKQPALRSAKVSNNANRISGGNTSSNNGSNASGSGSDGGGNNASSNTSNNPVVTAGSSGTATNSNNSSGSGSDGGSGSGNRQSGGEASNDYYYAGYGSGSLATNGSLHPHGGDGSTGAYHHYRHQEARMPDMPTFASFRGSSLAAAASELNQNHSIGGNLPGALSPAMLGDRINSARRVLVTADDAMNPPNITSSSSHLRHHSRHIHHRRTPTESTPADQAAPSLSSGIPSTIGPSANHHNIRLPTHDENEQHVSVMANRHFPPPPAGNDCSKSVARGDRKRPASTSTTTNASVVASMANSQSSAVHVSTDDPILKPSMFSHSPQKKVVIKSNSPQVHSLKEPVPCAETSKSAANEVKATTKASLKRKAFMLGSLDDSSDGARSDTEACGSGSDEGYEASSSSNAERQSGSSGSDSVSSDDANKVAKTRGNTSATNAGKKNPSLESHSGQSGKRTETSSMSSSVLADFSSGLNELNSLSSSPNSSSCNSLDDLDTNGAVKAKSSHDGGNNQGPRPMETEPTGRNHRKRSHFDSDFQETDIVMSAPDTTMTNGLALMEKSLQQKVRSSHHYHSRSTGRKMLEESFLSAKRNLSSGSSPDDAKAITASALDSTTSSVSASGSATMPKGKVVYKVSNSDRPMKEVSFQDTLIYSLGPDAMALIVSYLSVPESHTLLTSPLSKTWLETYTVPQELWKILCTSKPFYAKLEENPEGSSNASACSFPLCNDLEVRHLFGRYRLLYSSFVRCVKYLDRLKDDAINGRTPSVYNESQQDPYPTTQNGSLKAYFARARRLVRRTRRNAGSPSSSSVSDSLTPDSGEEQKVSENKPQAAASSSGSENSSSSRQDLQPRFGRSMLTERLLRPTRSGDVDNVNLPWSCAIYSVVNWMVAFVDVEGIQIMCLKVLPYLLEDETQRTTAQRAGLTDSVLRAMVIFPDSIELHTAAFHTLVLLARPLGGNEGMLFHTAMVNIRGIFDSGNNSSNNSKNGIVIMLDSMRRFAQDEMLQAMSCWSLVNVALTPLQKSMLVRLGGLTVTANAMLQHPYNAEVQFRALFALINLVIPSDVQTEQTEEQRDFEREVFQQLGEVGETSEREMLDASVGQISNLVVVAMKNFCSSEAILNRACLVLHNLSLREAYHSILLWTPNCYQMLEWCIGNYPHDHVLQQSAGGTITRLNATLSSDDELRARFTDSIRAQQQHSLQMARREAAYLQEQAERENTDQVSSV